MRRFRLPRKTKKILNGKIWLYAPDKNGDSLVAKPASTQEDYEAWRHGVLKRIDQGHSNPEDKEIQNKLDEPVQIANSTLREYVNDIFVEDIRHAAYNKLVIAKDDRIANRAYYNFINAYRMWKKGDDDSGNICCMALDRATNLLRKSRKARK